MINALEARLVACHLHLPEGQIVGPNTPIIALLHNRTWAENTVPVITDKKGVTHLYLHNPGLELVEIQRKKVVSTTDKLDAFHFNMLANEAEMAGIFGTEVATFWSRLPSRNGARQLPTQVK
jgi:hypothetical protein